MTIVLLELAEAVVKLGLPVTVLSWFLLGRLYLRGALDPGASRDELKAGLAAYKQSSKAAGSRADLIDSKWMKFGGGFYGVAGLWTLVVIELSDLVTFVSEFQGVSATFEGGLLAFLIGALVEQFTNFVTALVWFSWWMGEGGSFPVWFFTPWAGFWLGNLLARTTDLRSAVRSLVPPWRQRSGS